MSAFPNHANSLLMEPIVTLIPSSSSTASSAAARPRCSIASFRPTTVSASWCMGADHGARWRADEVRESRMVFIGRDMPKDVLLEGLRQCMARAPEQSA